MVRHHSGAGLGTALKVGCFVMVLVFILAVVVWFLIQAQCVRYTGGYLTGGDLFDTETLDYYVLQYTETETTYFLEDYYVSFGGKWIHHKETLPLEKDAYQYIKITRNATVNGR